MVNSPVEGRSRTDLMDRAVAASIGKETVHLVEAGEYVSRTGQRVVFREAAARAVERTRDVPPDAAVAAPKPGERATRIEVTNETTLEAGRRLAADGARPAALNFASAHKPGGGFLTGARAQEESLARSSALHACLLRSAMYDHHGAARDPMYTSWVVHSPDVPVIRDDDGKLLEEAWTCTFLTSPAVNAKVLLERDPGRGNEVLELMRARVRRVLDVAASFGDSTLVLGAWGCGVFGNDPTEIANLFGEALEGPHRGVFDRVVFAVLDFSSDRRFVGPFRARFVG